MANAVLNCIFYLVLSLATSVNLFKNNKNLMLYSKSEIYKNIRLVFLDFELHKDNVRLLNDLLKICENHVELLG